MAKILILEPDQDAAGGLSDAIQKAGLPTIVVSDGQSAIAEFEAESPDLIILDLAIDDGQGLKVCQAIRKTPGGELVPVLLVGTGQEGVQNFGDALAEGGDYYFAKPLDFRKVISKIRTYVGVDRESPTQVVARPGPPPEEQRSSKDLAGRVEQMMGLGEVFKDGLLSPQEDGQEGDEGEDGEDGRLEQLEKQLFGAEQAQSGQSEGPAKDPGKETTAKALLPPSDKDEQDEEPEAAEFPEELEQIDRERPVLQQPLETETGSEITKEYDSSSKMSEIDSELARLQQDDDPEEEDELAQETHAWDRIEGEMKKPADEATQIVSAAELEEKAKREAEEKTKREGEEKAKREAEEKTKREAEEKAKREAEEKTKREAEERAKRETEEKAKREAEEKAKREAEEKAKREAEEKAKREAQEKAQREAEEKAKREAEEKAQREAEEKAKREAEEKARLGAEAVARKEAEKLAWQEADHIARMEAEARARRVVQEKAQREAEEKALRKAEEKAKREAEEKAKREAEEKARREAEEKAKREAEEKAKREAEEKAKREANEKAQREAEEQALREAEEKAKRDAEEKAKREAEEKAKREAEEKAKREAEEKAKREAEEQARLEAEKAAPSPPVEVAQEDQEEQETVTSDIGMPIGEDEGYLEEEVAGTEHPLQAEDLWGDSMEEPTEGLEHLAEKASAWMDDRLEKEQEPEEPPATSHGGNRLVELLEKEATLAREQAVEEPEPADIEPTTDSSLPPRPGEETGPGQEQPEPLHPPGDFPEEKTEDLKAQGSFLLDDPASDDFDEPTTSQLGAARQKLRALEFDRQVERPPVKSSPAAQKPAAPVGPVAQPDFLAPDPERTDLSQESAPAVLWRMHVQEVTGMVTFRSQGGSKEVFFEAGIPVDVRSSQTADRLEEVLFRDGLIDRAAYAEARIKGIEQPRALAAHLVERGLIRPEELFPLVRRHLEDCLLGLFEWVEGSVSFSMTYAPDAEKVRLARPMPSLILEGIRRKYLLDRMVAEVGSPASLLVAVAPEDRSSRMSDLGTLDLQDPEDEILRLVNGLRPIEEVVFLSGQTAATVYRVLLAGVITGWLAVAVRGVRAGGPGASGAADESTQRNLEISRRRVEAKYDQINRASYFEILGVSEDSTAYEIEAAYKRLSREFHPVQFAHPDLQAQSDKLAAIRRTLDEARDVLTDELLREGYRLSLS